LAEAPNNLALFNLIGFLRLWKKLLPPNLKKIKAQEYLCVKPNHRVDALIRQSCSENACQSCQGDLIKMGEDVSEQLEYIPGSLKVIEHVRREILPAFLSKTSLLGLYIAIDRNFKCPFFKISDFFFNHRCFAQYLTAESLLKLNF
jgi:hypothetical protein